MQMIRTGSACALLLAHACASAQSTTQPIQQVIVQVDAGNARAQSTTTTIVVGRDDIVRHGDASLLDVLKRQPGVTVEASPGRAAAVRMRGMGAGYVTIMLNGQAAPSGFSLESISPDLVERIEILRAATAETGGQAVAGAINVILRRAGPAKGGDANTFSAGSALVDGHAAPQLTAQHSGRIKTLAYTFAATVKRHVNPIAATTTEEGSGPALLRHIAWTDDQVMDTLEFAPRLTWQPGPLDSITSQSYVRKRHIDNAKRENEVTEIGLPTAFARTAQRYEARPLSAYADVAWTRKLGPGARFVLKLSGFHMASEAGFVYRGMDRQGSLVESHLVASGPREGEWTLSGNWRRPLGRNHTLAAGWEFGRKERTEYRRERQTDADGRLLLVSDEDYRAKVSRSAFFVQDEWDIDAAWSVYAGLRREALRTTGAGNADAPVDIEAGAWSPVFQALFKPQGQDGDNTVRDQFRLAASRTYKAPGIVQLMPRRYTVDNNNSATNPDQQGNPTLRPELAFGVDFAWERYIGKGDMVSVSAFHKRIRDITLVQIGERGGVWTAMPVNQGDATVRGIEIEGKATRGPFSVRANFARNWSRVDSVPGPDNRIEGQTPYSGNLGLDYAAQKGRLDLGGTFTYRTRVPRRVSALLFSDDGPRRQLDLYAVWKRDTRSRLRLSVSDLLHRDYTERLAYEGARPLARTTVYRVRPVWRVTWEQSL